MLTTFLFDLDGTLLGMDLKLFETLYFKAMAEDLSNLIQPSELMSHVWASTAVMIKNLDYKTNEEVFMEDFRKRIDGDLETYKASFYRFYDQGFLKTKKSTVENTFIQKSVRLLKEKGYGVAVATNPIFPLKANLHRIRWAGFEPTEFDYISHYEKNHFCKPQIEFYEEVLQDINKEATECMMVGNDVQEDLIASQLGMKTFLIEDYLIHRNEEEIVTDYRGRYEDFYQFVHTLPSRMF